jgi:hypothetical protein
MGIRLASYMEGKTVVHIKIAILGLAIEQHKILFKLITILKFFYNLHYLVALFMTF